jgi:phosphoribosyl 1,2-cyclic phosphodiesterase
MSKANSIKFLGTAGARMVVAKQLRSSAGTLLNLDGHSVLIDPGPGTLARCASSKPKIDPANLEAIILTHRHIDHSTDINVMIEAITEGGFKKRGKVFAPADCLEGEDPVILRYLRAFPEKIEILKAHTQYDLDGLRFTTSGRHYHPVETYGLIFDSKKGKIAFLADTDFLPELADWYAKAKVLVINVVRLKPHESAEVQHLTLDEARQIIVAVKPKVAILTHFGMTMLRAKPWELAEKLTKEIGIRVVAASDGLNFSLDEKL